jgi:hypothetical protein
MTTPCATAAAASCGVDADPCLVNVATDSSLVVIEIDDPSIKPS